MCTGAILKHHSEKTRVLRVECCSYNAYQSQQSCCGNEIVRWTGITQTVKWVDVKNSIMVHSPSPLPSLNLDRQVP
jgi:hypothetical protein